MYTVGIKYNRPTEDKDKVGEVEFSLEQNPDGSIEEIPQNVDGNNNLQKVVAELMSILLAHPNIDRVTFTMKE